MNNLVNIYKKLYSSYGPQGWWPLLELENNIPVNITKSGCIRGYHPGDYSYPRDQAHTFEICIGAILTQNTNWVSVEKALVNLKGLNALTPASLKKLDIDKLKVAIRPAGYYNMKSKKVKIFTDFFIRLKGRVPSRDELLDVWGIGNETADSMLLYGFKVPSFVVDAYTRRIFSNLGFFDEKASYEEIKELFEKNIKKDLIVYQEYHALIVEHAKRFYSKKPYGTLCPIRCMTPLKSKVY